MVSDDHYLTPTPNTDWTKRPWEGSDMVKPWMFQLTAAIPHNGTPNQLTLAVELLRRQTCRPYIVIIDTGSRAKDRAAIAPLESDDCEIHHLRCHGRRHPSDYPAIACDLALALCQTPYLYLTHSDVFPRRRDLLEDLRSQCSATVPAVGYEITPRPHPDWRGMISHTCSLLHVDTLYRIGGAWNLRHCARKFGLADHNPDPKRPNWPDTEVLLNYQLRAHHCVVRLIGTEENGERTVDANIDHCRSLTIGRLYDNTQWRRANGWWQHAHTEGLERVAQWGDPLPLPECLFQ